MNGLHHGGRLAQAVKEYGIPRQQWLDLSTGVSPWTYPVGPIAAEHWNRLPELEDGLEDAARGYYRCDSLLAVAGSQAAIQAIPRIWQQQQEGPLRVGLPRVGYKEHQKAWQRVGAELVFYDQQPSDAMVASLDVLVVINPNNPTAHQVKARALMAWHQQLRSREGLLLVDEAFADVDPAQSISAYCPRSNLVVLRSIGKFFGLAGIRAGFVLAPAELLDNLAVELGPWTLAGPSRQLCRQALEDKAWQVQQRQRLHQGGQRLATLLSTVAEPGVRVQGTPLFQLLPLANARQWHQALCRLGIFTRLTDEGHALRFGLPECETDWQRLETGLRQCQRRLAASIP